MDFKSITEDHHKMLGMVAAVREGIDIVLGESVGSLNDRQKHFLELAARNINKLDEIIESNFELQQKEFGGTEPDTGETNKKDEAND